MKVFGLTWLQLLILVLTCAQNSGYSLIRRYSQGVLKEQVKSSTVLMVGEIMKLGFSIVMVLTQEGGSGAPEDVSRFKWLIETSAPMVVPAVVYLIMNLLSFISLQYIDAGLFTVIAQAKILTTAIFGRVCMDRSLHPRKWRALILMVMGASLISNQNAPAKFGPESGKAVYEFLVGIGTSILEITLSGAISVYFEKVLKKKTTTHTVWDRNIQLSVMSGVAYFILSASSPDVAIDAGYGLFNGFSLVTLLVSVVGAMGGILVALAVKYTDSVMKCLATSGSIVVTTYVGAWYLGAALDFVIGVASTVVILAVFNYFDEGGAMDATPRALNRVPPSDADEEKGLTSTPVDESPSLSEQKTAKT